MTIEIAKKAAALAAANLIQDGMTVGLGSGTTATFFTEHLVRRVKNGLKIKVIASSSEAEHMARMGSIPLLDILNVTSIDMTVDGADEIDSSKRMIKGGGGALVRERILAALSKEMVVIVHESKLVEHLGKVKLPVEIIPFGCHATEHHLAKLGYKGTWRKIPSGGHFVTDNHNYILDIHFSRGRSHPEKDHLKIKEVPGVVDTGFFLDLAGRVIVGYLNGEVKVWN
ncbi:MAG TPA: ribose-5-phosphate isomerase RpiA [Rhabdochlamydiaceae bacterium]|nr:ribose-5-phosphate isomerase RpiA [Rhabdochlamydiaceae bacterium]